MKFVWQLPASQIFPPRNAFISRFHQPLPSPASPYAPGIASPRSHLQRGKRIGRKEFQVGEKGQGLKPSLRRVGRAADVPFARAVLLEPRPAAAPRAALRGQPGPRCQARIVGPAPLFRTYVVIGRANQSAFRCHSRAASLCGRSGIPIAPRFLCCVSIETDATCCPETVQRHS